MSILGAMFTAVSGLNAQSRAMGAISDNIANSQTVGYKKVGTRFESLITVSNSNMHQPGGVVASPYYANGLQGNVTQTQTNTNLALSGNGFFVVSRPTGQTANQTTFSNLPYYTRAGDFDVNRDGYMVNGSGYYLNGWSVDQNGVPNTASLAPIKITQVVDEPTPTSKLDFVGNLPANSPLNPTPPLAPTNIQVFDALGNPHTISLNWTKRADNIWKLDIQAPDSTSKPVGGTITGVNDQAMSAPVVVTPNVPPAAQVDTITVPAMAAGATVTYSIGANPIVITAPAGGYTSAQAAAAIVSKINSDPGLSSLVKAGNINTVGGTAQVDTVSIPAAGLTAGQTISLTVNGQTVNVAAPAGGWTQAQAATALQAAIATNLTVSAVVTAADIGTGVTLTANTAGQAFIGSVGGTGGATEATTTANVPGNGTLQVTASTPGTPFVASIGGTVGATSATTTPNISPVAQVDSITLSGTVGAMEVGDTWSITVGTSKVSYVNTGTETSLTDVANGLANLINANPSIGVNASVAGGVLNLTARNAGTPFAVAGSATNGNVPGFIDVQFGVTPATAGKVTQITNAYNLAGNAQIPTSQNANDPAVISFQVDYGTGPQTITLDLGKFQTSQGLTQFEGDTIAVQRFTQDGVPQGLLKDVNIRNNGDVEITYDNGRSRTYFKVPVAQFYDTSALKREDGQAFVETFDSGTPRLSGAGENGAGVIRGSAQEDSNVDIAEEFSKMIVTQRSYSANTRIITTSDEMLQDILSIKR